jgi:8-oxo-dGTP pyrophosphatase MutT (NUDIX family)
VNAVRLSVKAIVVRDDALLVLRCRDDDGDWYLLPGGGQERGETVHEALQRECREEIGCEVQIHRLRFIRDYIAGHHEFADVDDSHQVELMFECTLLSEPTEASTPDLAQVGYAWLPMHDLGSHRLYPRALVSALAAPATPEALYLGDCN